MTAQQSLDRVWAATGGVTDPGEVKYSLGWISEIPLFEDFNYVLQSSTKNLLKLAERGAFDWEAAITYQAGAVAKSGNRTYHCHTTNTGEDPVLDTLHNYWNLAPHYGNLPSPTGAKLGLFLDNVDASTAATGWVANSQTILAGNPIVAFNIVGGADNFLLTNVAGFMSVVNVSTDTQPTGQALTQAEANVHKIYHEGNKPVQADVDDTIPTEPQDGKLYARRSGSWIEVTATTISATPPNPVNGAGQGWYNLNDGIMYVDINDGTSSQWVPAAPARAPAADTIAYDNSTSGLTAITMQAAIDELANLV